MLCRELCLFRSGDQQRAHLLFNVPKSGNYHLLLGVCDPSVHNAHISGQMVAMSSYGHLPGSISGMLPFMKIMAVLFSVLLFVWIYRCCSFRKELMSVHLLIFVMLIALIADCVGQVWSLSLFNKNGAYNYSVTVLSLVVSSFTRALARCIALALVLG